VIFFLLGIAVLAVGIYSRVENDTWKDLVDMNVLEVAADLLIAAGVIVALIGFLGCFGAWKKVKVLLIIYSILVILIFILEVAAGGYAYSNKKEVQDALEEHIRTGINTNYGKTDTASEGVSKAVDWFQRKVKCCGAVGARDWENSYWYKNIGVSKNKVVPESCCESEKEGCNVGITYSSKNIYSEGCVDAGVKFAKDNLWLVGGVGVGIGVVELLSIIFAIGLCSSFKKDETTA